MGWSGEKEGEGKRVCEEEGGWRSWGVGDVKRCLISQIWKNRFKISSIWEKSPDSAQRFPKTGVIKRLSHYNLLAFSTSPKSAGLSRFFSQKKNLVIETQVRTHLRAVWLSVLSLCLSSCSPYLRCPSLHRTSLLVSRLRSPSLSYANMQMSIFL